MFAVRETKDGRNVSLYVCTHESDKNEHVIERENKHLLPHYLFVHDIFGNEKNQSMGRNGKKEQ